MKKKALYTKPDYFGETKTIITATISITKEMHRQLIKGKNVSATFNGEHYQTTMLIPRQIPVLYKKGMKLKLDFRKCTLNQVPG